MSLPFPAPAAAAAEDDVRDAVIVDLERIAALLGGDPAPRAATTSGLDHIARTFGLTGFERDILLLAAAVELDGPIAEAVAQAQHGASVPTFALALATLPDPHWDAISPDRALRRQHLIRLAPGENLSTRGLRIDESVLHRIAGIAVATRDGLALLGDEATPLTPTQEALARELAAAVQAIDARVLVRLDGADADTRRSVIARVATLLGGGVLAVRDGVLDQRDQVEAAAVLDREAALDELLLTTAHPGLLGLLEAPVIATDGAADVPARVTVARTVSLPTVAEQIELWREHAGTRVALLGDSAAAPELSYLFRLPARAIVAVAEEWRSRPDANVAVLRGLARDRARVGFGILAERIEPRATWDDLVLPDAQLALLHDIEHQLRHRGRVYDEWGFAASTSRGLGVSALFAGESGTGKTMTAEVLAGALGLDLYRIDLAAVVSKYIGETEKNLGTVFEAAEASGAVLLFDEADALFSKRSEVRDSHDRYANLEVAYLLQRMEAYRGLAILTTNMRTHLDRAFLRRLRSVVLFPFPDAAFRAEIWRRAFPAAAPTAGLDADALAAMQLSGGSIRSIVLSAAFAAADAGTPILPEHILRAARLEVAKSERTLTDAETALLRTGGVS